MESSAHVQDGNRKTLRSLGAENRRLRKRLVELERERAASERARTEAETVMAVAAHELLSPLIAIDAFAFTVADRLDASAHAASRSDLDTLRIGTTHARLLADTLLLQAITREHPRERRPVEVRHVVHECLRLLAPEVDVREARVQIGELPVVEGDETLIRALFANLISNALKYGPRTGGKITIDATPLNSCWRFCVGSQGPTIPLEDRRRIFEVYRRGLGERRVRGAGLGLAICRHIVARHGGRIWVAPARGIGNRFYFTLPA
jgi:signal transduction histidine kinase